MPKATRYDVQAWLTTVATGEFHYKDIMDGQIDPSSFGNLRKIMSEFSHGEDAICEPIGRRDGYYRVIQDGAAPLDFSNMNRRKDFPIDLPFELRKYVFIYPDTTLIYAGSKSSGKTGLIYRTVAMNRKKINTILLTNLEGGSAQLYDRFLAMDIDLAKEPKFVYHVTENYHDYIKLPNTIYAIDYIDAPEGVDFYVIGASIAKVDKKLKGLNSIAVIGLQKPSQRDTAFGGEQTLKVASLYLALDSNRLKIVDAKVHTDKKVNPKNMQWAFRYDDEGTTFTDIKPFHGGLE